MSRPSDFSYEMSGELPQDDAFPAAFAEEARFAVSGPPPVPSMALAAVLKAGRFAGVSPNDKGDLLVTAASNVHGPAPQAAGLPNWKKEKRDMPVSGVLVGLLAKLGHAGTTAKAAVAGATALATMGLAGGAAGMLPGPAQSLVASAISSATPFEFPSGDVTGAVQHAVGAVPRLPAPVAVPAVPATPGAPPVSVGASATGGSSSASGPSSTGAAPPAVVPTLPGVPALPQVTVPPAVAGLVKGLPACVTNLVPAGGGAPDPAKLATQIPSCITQVLGTANLPPEVARCVSSVLGAIGGASGMSTASVPNIDSLNMSSCVPLDASRCVSSVLGLLGTLPKAPGGLPSIGSLPGLSNLGSLTGCVPMNVSTCINSLTAAASAGTTPKLDLSACMPTTLPTGVIPNVGGLPGLNGALAFFGR